MKGRDTTLGRALFLYRCRHDMTLQQMADLLEVHTTTLYKWERGKSYPNYTQVQRMLDLGFSPWDIFTKVRTNET